MYNFLFLNFNYTSLLDNYIFLDKEQFDPEPYRTVVTNFKFFPNPCDYDVGDGMYMGDTKWSSYVLTNIVHPHGYQSIPRSLLFGIEEPKYRKELELKKFNKSYWAQSNRKYQNCFDKAELFIIYGTSIGETDSWWWSNVVESLKSKNSELIIYYYDKELKDSDVVKEKFIIASKVNLSLGKREKIKERIYVVFNDGIKDLNMFGLGVKK